jgi:hypothetical protein
MAIKIKMIPTIVLQIGIFPAYRIIASIATNINNAMWIL